MADIFDRLQLVNHEEIFATREEAVNYVLGLQTIDRPALLAEPMILLYESEDATKGPNVILAIGSVGDGSTPNTANRTFFIDTQKTEEEIEGLRELIEEAIKSLTIVPLTSDTINMFAEKTEDGTFLSGNVKIADYRIVSGKVEENIIETDGEKGIYAFVDMDYDPDTFIITFRTTKVSKEFQLPKDLHVEKGWYDVRDESIHLKLADGTIVPILLTNLIEEWTVLGEASNTPLVLIKEHVSAITEGHDGIYDWQDVLSGDVRVASHINDNILQKDRTGRYLYVKGTADNILYKDGQTVKEALDNVDCKVSTSAGNLIYKRPDGIYATAMVGYNTAENKLTYTYSEGNTGELKTVEFQLNSVKLLEDITYDPVNETIVIRYIDAQGEYQKVVIPVKDIIEEWDVNNEAHNILLNKYRSQGQGKDILSADAKIHNGDNNILEDKNHELYVKGVASNIKYDVTGDTTVKDVLDGLSGVTDGIQDEIDRIDATIGSGFTSGPHENITAKFEQLNEKIESEIERSTEKDNELEAKIDAEIERSTEKDTEHDGKIQAIEDEIGDGFGPRNTVRDEIDNLQDEIDSLSAETASKLADIDSDNSINIDKTNPTVPVISVNLSEEPEQGRPNIIKLNNDGLYAGVDLAYEETANKLIFTTTNGSKEIQLESMSSIISIEYNPSKEAIVITYMTNGHEIKVVEIPVGDLIDEWRVEDGHPHAVLLEKVRESSGTTEKDVLKASVIITDDHDDNILVMDDGALYVSGAQIAANADAISGLTERMNNADEKDQELENAINTEVVRATTQENYLLHLIEDEAERRISGDAVNSNSISIEEARARDAESRLETALTNETNRAQAKESELNTAITNETIRANAADTELYQSISDETAARTYADAVLDTKISNETTSREAKDTILETKIDTEISRSTSEDERLSNLITAETAARQAADAELADSIRATILTFEDTHSVDFTKDENNNVKANVKLANAPDNIILIDEAKDGVYASVDLNYESSTNKIKFKVNGNEKEFTIAAGSILDDAWYDPVTKNLVFKTKTASGEFVEVTVPAYDLFDEWYPEQPVSGTALSLTLTTGRTDPTTHEPLPNVLSGSVLVSPLEDNLLIMDTNGLYVPGSGSSMAQCVDNKVNKVYKLLYGDGAGIDGCGENIQYVKGNGCIISAATSFSEADQMLNDAFCRFIDDWEVYGFDTPSNHTDWLKIGQNRHMLVDTRLSHGSNAYEGGMTDDELTISKFDDDYIDPTKVGFTDTNVIRLVNVEKGKSGETLEADNLYNGIYLSNSWDCGLYYGMTAEDQAAKAAAEAAGYNTNYSTDEDASAGNFNYMNNVRQSDI